MKNLEPTQCPFRFPAGPPNKMAQSPGEENDTFNDSGVLTENLLKADAGRGRAPATHPPTSRFPMAPPNVADVRKNGPHLGKNVGVLANAHHLVPGHASLPYSGIVQFLGDKDNMPKKAKVASRVKQGGGGIGYDVNDKANGKWLPSMNALRGAWQGEDYQAEYAFLAINKAGAAFHDSHTDYNDFCIDLLEQLKVKLDVHIQTCGLKPCIDKRSGGLFEHGPYPYLTRKLYSVARRLGRYLDLGQVRAWNLYEVTTSRFNSVYREVKETYFPPCTIDFLNGKEQVQVTEYAIQAVKRGLKTTARQ